MPSKLDPEITRQTLAGYATVNRIAEAERRARLQAMTPQEARVHFDDLCASGVALARDDADWERILRRRLEHKIEVRRAFDRLARTLASS